MNCTLFQLGKGLSLFLVTFFTAASLSASASELSPPPVFLDPAPADVVVDCYNDRPPVVSLRAQTDAGIVNVNPRDSLGFGTPSICSGGVVFRIWEISDDEGSARVVQQITFGPSTDGPTINPTIDVTPDTVECTRVNDPNDPLSYSSWLADKQLAVISAARPGCAPIVSITDDGPANLIGADCNDQVTVTFTVLDQCFESATVAFNYVVEDHTPPVFFGDTTDLALECGTAVPAVANVFATDCGPDPTVIFNQVSTQTNNGGCGDLDYQITRTWTATDDCGNTSMATQVITFTDDEQPFFTRPFNLEILCTQDYQDTTLTGSIFNLSDNCTPTNELVVTYTDVVINQPDCNFNFNVRRTWTVVDRCGNRNSQVQNIFVGDNEAPLFTPPANTSVNCEDVFNFAVVGEPTELSDNCTVNPNVTFTDVRSEQVCANTYRLRRTWRIFDDCGNDEFHVQDIMVTDTVAPVFSTPPTNLVTTCNNEQNQDELFNLWVINRAGARAMDECSSTDSITYQVFISGTTQQPLLPELRCDFLDQTVRQLSIDIIATDQCGNQRVATATFRQIDTQAPDIFDCPQSSVIATDPGFCGANVALEPPTIVDQCVTGLPDSHVARDTVQITSNAQPGNEGTTPVNTVVLNFPITAPLPTNALLPSELVITLENVDGEGTEEFFRILGEDGSLLGITSRTDVQCATSVTNLQLTRLQYNQWAVDGVIRITLEPNIPANQSGAFAVNDLCAGGSRAIGFLRTPIRRLSPINYQIFIDDQAPVRVDPVDTYFALLDAGLHQITYRVTDCAGNTDECTFTITVEDRVPPVITCPQDTVVDLVGEECHQLISVPLPLAVVDNCNLFEVQELQSPVAAADRFLTYNFDPNLNTYQANAIIADFPPIAPYTFDTIDVIVRYRGDFNTNNAILEVLDNDGNLLGQSQQGDASCDQEGTLLIRIPANQFNDLVRDNDFGLVLRPRQISVPPGQTGDGVNPCDPLTVTEDGQTDGISYAYAALSYQLLQPDYFTTGATVTPRTSLTDEVPVPLIDFNLGETQVSYIIGDPSGNIDTCTFTLTLRDRILPTVICQPTTIFIDPSGLEPITIDPAIINNGSTDNCSIDTIFLTPATFNCDLIGTSQNITLNVVDGSGNTNTCSTTVGVSALRPIPTADSGFCGGDTLFLFANPPSVAAPGQTIYTFRWFNPSGAFISDAQNPIIPSVDADDEGPYRVEITGISGCITEGVVNVNIEELPLTPAIAAPQSVCIGDPIPLTSPTTFTGNIVYQWFEGIPGNGTLLGTSPVPNFMVAAPHGDAGREFYLVALVNGCSSAPSTSVTVTTVARPEITVLDDSLTSCEFLPVNLRASVLPNVNYTWTGPNGFTATGSFVTIAEAALASSGTYYVSAVRNQGCFSNVDSIELTVIPATPTATLSSNGPVCLGETLILTASNDSASTYVFLGPNGAEIQTDTFQLTIPSVTFSEMGDWRVIVNRGDCPSLRSAPLSVTVNSLPVAQTMLLPDPVCAGNNVVLQGSSSVGGSNYFWSASNGFTSNLIAPVLNNVTQNMSDNYILTVTAPNGCTDTDTLVVDVLPGIFVTGIAVVDEGCLVGGETVALVANLQSIEEGENYSYQWSGPMGITGTGDTLYLPDVSPLNSGSYSVRVSNEAGCVSSLATFTVDLQFAPATPLNPITDDGASGYCLGENFTIFTTDYGPGTNYFWQLPGGATIVSDTNQITLNAFDVNFSGNYRVRVVRGGCSSPFSGPTNITITLFPAMAVSTNSPVCESEPINLQVTDLPGATYSWRGPNNFSSSLASPVIGTANPSLHNGTYRVVVTIGGCSSDTLETTVFVQPKPRVPVGVPHAPLCVSDADASLTLSVNPNTATSGATYQWYINNGTVPVGSPTNDLSLTLTDFSLFPMGGLVSFFVQTELDGCLSNLSNAVNVRLDLALENAADAGPDTTICEGLYLLQAVQPAVGTGRWELIAGEGEVFIANPNSALTAVSGMTQFSGPYTFVWSLTNGTCVNYSQDTVVISATNGEAAFAGPDILACLNTDVALGAVPVQEAGSVGTWSQNQAQELLGVVIVEPTNPATVITGLQPDNIYSFTWTVRSNCGVKTDGMLVNVSDPAPDAGPNAIVCNDDATTILFASEPTVGSSGRWRGLDPSLTISDPESPTTMVGNLSVGDNFFVWEIDEGSCGLGSADTLVIEYKETSRAEDDIVIVPFQGVATFDPLENDFVPANSSVNIPAAPAQGSLMDAGNGQFTFTAPPNFVGEVTIDYQLLSDGCTNSMASITFRIGENADCGAPNIFTPNNDGVNDFFVVPCLLDTDEFPNSEVLIFNQWGDEVYRSPRPYQGNWDGRFNGEELPVGTYFYLIDFGDNRDSESGHVRIQR